jgi:outer membrane lipoprotein-sorting protein
MTGARELFKKLLAGLLMLTLFLSSCAVTGDKVLTQIEKKTAKLQSFYAELEVLVFSPAGEQSYHIKQWQAADNRWRVEVTAAAEAQHFICDGQQIWVYQLGIDDYYRIVAERGSLELAPPFMLTGYLQQLQQADAFTFAGTEELRGEKMYKIISSGQRSGETLHLWLDRKAFFPMFVETYLHEQLLNRITVKRLELNPQLQPELFEFSGTPESEVTAQCRQEQLTLAEAREGWPGSIFIPTYLPAGSSLFAVSRTVEENREHLILVYQGTWNFTLVQQPKTNESVYRSASTSQVQIGQRTGLYQQNSDHSLGTLWWSNEQNDFVLTGTLPCSEMIKIAASLKPEGV